MSNLNIKQCKTFLTFVVVISDMEKNTINKLLLHMFLHFINDLSSVGLYDLGVDIGEVFRYLQHIKGLLEILHTSKSL